MKSGFRKCYCVIACCMLLISFPFSVEAKDGTSLVSSTVSYKTSSGQSSSGKSSMPIYIGENKITIGSIPLSVLNILKRTEQGSDNLKKITYTCKNSKGTGFVVNLVFPSKLTAEMTIVSDKVTIVYKCAVSKVKPYNNMVDLGLSCKWGLANYTNYSYDVVKSTFHSGKTHTYDEALKIIGSGKQHLPSTSQMKELLTRCKWEFIENPFDDYQKCFLVTGPNGNSIILPCNDGKGNYSFAWYLSSDEFDAFLVNAMQLNIQSRVVTPYDRSYYGMIRLVEDK